GPEGDSSEHAATATTAAATHATTAFPIRPRADDVPIIFSRLQERSVERLGQQIRQVPLPPLATGLRHHVESRRELTQYLPARATAWDGPRSFRNDRELPVLTRAVHHRIRHRRPLGA